MVEFALVLPIFLLLVMGILDFGFLFYNYISLENAARNASRVACVEYDRVAYDFDNNEKITTRTITLPAENATSAAAYDGLKPGGVALSEEEIDICTKVADSVSHTGIVKEGITVTIQYTYDTNEKVISDGNWKRADRYKGDVVVTVKAKAQVLTPILGVTADHMKKDLTSSSTFKVEQQYTDS
ncbi:MAG: pilus assembly protein [Ruminococcaceae bacterium]|nr:pilus assembly protein [Oscillospiraceae bacterium]